MGKDNIRYTHIAQGRVWLALQLVTCPQPLLYTLWEGGHLRIPLGSAHLLEAV